MAMHVGKKALAVLAVAAVLTVGILTAWRYIRSATEVPPRRWSGGEIRVGYSSEPPYGYRTTDGTVTGQSPEIAKAVLEHLGLGPIRWVLVDFSQAMDALRAGAIDMIANGMFITPTRETVIAFSLPYSRSLQGLLVRNGNPKRLHGYDELVGRDDVVVAVLDGSVEQEMLRRLGMPAEKLFVVPVPVDGLTAVRRGRADCLALSAPTVAWLAREAPGEVAAAAPFHNVGTAAAGRSAFGFRREDARLREEVNRVLRLFIGSPEHLALAARFGFDRNSLPDWSRSP